MHYLAYGGTTRDEMTVTIRLDRADQQAHICSTWPEWSRKLERQYGSPKKTPERDGKISSAFWTVRLSLVSLRRPGRRAPMSEAQREASRERMRRFHQSRSEPRNVSQ